MDRLISALKAEFFSGGCPLPFFLGQFLDGMIFTNRYAQKPLDVAVKKMHFVDKTGPKWHFKMNWGFPGLVLPGVFYGLWMLELGVQEVEKLRGWHWHRGWLVNADQKWKMNILAPKTESPNCFKKNHLNQAYILGFNKLILQGVTAFFSLRKNSSDFPVVYLKFSAEFPISGEVNDPIITAGCPGFSASNTRSFPIKTKGQNIRVPGIYDRVLNSTSSSKCYCWWFRNSTKTS